MNNELKKVVRSLLPPAILSLLNGRGDFYFSGNYSTWKAADEASSGYADPNILKRVRASILAVKEGRAAFERDSVLFNKPDYQWHLLACLLKIAADNGGSLSVLDFGGALGSSFFQCRNFFNGLKKLEWSIVEQKHFVEDGKKHVEDDTLKFYFDILSCLSDRQPDVILLSSVIQYMPDPEAVVREIIGHGFANILVDRTPFISGNSDRLTLQTVSPKIYSAKYPAWFLSEDRFRTFFIDKYDLIAEMDCKDAANISSTFKGFLFQSKSRRK